MEEWEILDKESRMISITTLEYETLLADQAFLEALRAAGVDSWSGYAVAQDMISEE